MPIDIDEARFEEMVAEGLDSIPAELASRMDNVAVVVEDERGTSGPGRVLGLYEGVPLTKRTRSGGTTPDRITIYRKTICSICDTEEDVVEQVRRTVIHEVGHHFGIDDAKLRSLGW